jgi:hypothetical protein
MIKFQDKPYCRITHNCSNPDGLREKIFQSRSTGEIFRYVWNNHGWDIYERVTPYQSFLNGVI